MSDDDRQTLANLQAYLRDGHELYERDVQWAVALAASLSAENDELRAELRKLKPEPGFCEHGVKEGDWCEPCNLAYKIAARDAGYEDL